MIGDPAEMSAVCTHSANDAWASVGPAWAERGPKVGPAAWAAAAHRRPDDVRLPYLRSVRCCPRLELSAPQALATTDERASC